jgi:hypothetical protein
LIEACRFSENHDWAGITLTDKCSAYLNVEELFRVSPDFVKYRVPRKDGKLLQLDVVNWTKSIPKRYWKNFEDKIHQGFNKHYPIDDWAALRKLDNTVKFYKSLLNSEGA